MYEVLIIDLGGVLLDIDVERAVTAFRKLTPNPDSIPSTKALLAHPIFRQFETDELSPGEFREALREQFGIAGTNAQIDEAWNSLLLDPIPGRAEILNAWARNHTLILLSNTNRIHYQAFIGPCQEIFAPFNRLIYSFEVGMRKPDENIFSYTLKVAGCPKEKCLFLDDSPANINGARNLGIPSLQVDLHTDLSKIF